MLLQDHKVRTAISTMQYYKGFGYNDKVVKKEKGLKNENIWKIWKNRDGYRVCFVNSRFAC